MNGESGRAVVLDTYADVLPDRESGWVGLDTDHDENGNGV